MLFRNSPIYPGGPARHGEAALTYFTALRQYTAKRIEEIDAADILVGIPCYNNEKTVAHVIQSLTNGLDKSYRNLRNVILIADGGSTDDTREAAKEYEIKPWQEKIVSIYRGQAGKGTALRSVFEAAERLNVRACAVVDADLRSITSDWVFDLIDPVLDKDFDFVAPVYLRHKYDATITNNIVYNLTRALYGKRIRQPIGGDFAFSRDVAKFYSEQNVWDTDVARYGIDIWMTTTAITKGFKVCQSQLGVKIHDAKDPAQHLGPMFRQVMWILLSLMEEFEEFWKPIRSSEAVPLFGRTSDLLPEPIKVDLAGMIDRFKVGCEQFSGLWKDIFCRECFEEIQKAARLGPDDFHLPLSVWVQILYELAATFHAWTRNRFKIIELVTPLYYARVASFVRQTQDMDTLKAEALVEEQAAAFEENKPYLLKVWDEKSR
jgi:hypothetical protein